jgi:hypothetical protein
LDPADGQRRRLGRPDQGGARADAQRAQVGDTEGNKKKLIKYKWKS